MTKDYAPALWVPADPTNYRRGRPVQAPTLIVIHATDGHEHANPVAEMWQEPHHGSSAHFVIGQDGTVIQSVSIADTAWHAHAASGSSVGVEHCARTPRELGPHDPGLPPSDSLYKSSAKLVAWLCETLDIRVSRVAILGHAEADHKTTHVLCPTGCGWDWQWYMAMVASEFKARKVA